MNIFELDEKSIPAVSEFMARIKPEFWDVEGAIKQLGSGIGWYFGAAKDQPEGWILCKLLDGYKTLEISMGYLPSGILPNIYGDNYHGIQLVKQLLQKRGNLAMKDITIRLIKELESYAGCC